MVILRRVVKYVEEVLDGEQAVVNVGCCMLVGIAGGSTANTGFVV